MKHAEVVDELRAALAEVRSLTWWDRWFCYKSVCHKVQRLVKADRATSPLIEHALLDDKDVLKDLLAADKLIIAFSYFVKRD